MQTPAKITYFPKKTVDKSSVGWREDSVAPPKLNGEPKMAADAYNAGYLAACTKLAVFQHGIPEGPKHLRVEQLAKFLQGSEIEDSLHDTVSRRRRGKDHESSVTWGPKTPMEGGETRGNLGGSRPYGGV